MGSQPVSADGLLHPIALGALVLLIVNDHVLKGNAPAPLTGILSGIAGIVIFPLVLQAGWEVLAVLRSRWSGPSARAIGWACIVTGVGYAAVEIHPLATEAYRFGWGVLQWPAPAIVALLSAEPFPPLVPVLAIADPWDLTALPVLVIPWLLGRERAER